MAKVSSPVPLMEIFTKSKTMLHTWASRDVHVNSKANSSALNSNGNISVRTHNASSSYHS